jgi:hypothetical protein
MVRHHGKVCAIQFFDCTSRQMESLPGQLLDASDCELLARVLAEVLLLVVAPWWWGEGGQLICVSYGRWGFQGLLKQRYDYLGTAGGLLPCVYL